MTNASMTNSPPPVIIYTTPACPDCQTLKDWLAREEIAFEARDLSDRNVMEEANADCGVLVAPIKVVDQKTFFCCTYPSEHPGLARALGLANLVGKREP
jgi:glutaredoxin